jgi:hypothetical protein
VAVWDGICIPETVLPNDKATSFIIVKLAPGSSTSELYELTAAVAHEVFHSFQCAFDYWEDTWWEESSAVWSEEFINPQWNTEVRLPDVFNLSQNRQRQLTLKDPAHEYAIYLFPYYLEKIDPGDERIIADIWKACEEDPSSEDVNDSLTAIDRALGGKFDTTFRDFAVVNLDDDPYTDRYLQPLDLFEYHGIFEWTLDVIGEGRLEIQHALPPLAANYDRVHNKLDRDVTPLVRFRMDEFADNDKLFLHAIISSHNGDTEEDWSNRSERVFCINRDEEWFDSITLVMVSAEATKSHEFVPTTTGDQPSQEEEDEDVEIVSPPKIIVSTETAPCRPIGGTGQFSINKERKARSAGPTDSTFSESVTGQITFEPYDHDIGGFRGRASVRLAMTQEIHRADYEDEYINHNGSGEVECILSYPWGNEDATFSLSCEMLEGVKRHWRRVHHDPLTGDTETSGGNITRTDIDEWCIRLHPPATLERHQLDLSGSYRVDEPVKGGTRSDSCSWTIILKRPVQW